MRDDLDVGDLGGILPIRLADACSRHASRLAIVGADESLTFADLAERSARLAAGLRASGIAIGGCVGLALPRGAARLVALHAIWRVGAAAVMLDPSWPDLRLSEVSTEAGCALVLAEEGRLPGAVTPAALEHAAAAAPVAGDAAVQADDLAYIIYTSGSTGRPKGVEITHGNLAALVAWHEAAFAVTPDDRATHLAGLAFDASVWEVWPYLAAGASVHVVPDAVRTAGDRLLDWLVAQGITIAFVPTLLAEQLVALPWPATPLRLLLTGGDRLRTAPPAGLPFALVNNYGPTECTVVATSGVVLPASEAGPPAIGRPIAGSYIRILDDTGRPVDDGETGEIHIGGALVGRGYRGQPAATAAAFVHDPFADQPGARLYRTGDLGRWRADGRIEFRGRVDDQLKIRGQRIEPDEVAALLMQHEAVAAAAVAGIEQGDGLALVAYVAAKPDMRPTAEALHGFLAARLPDWSVPGAYVAVDRLPVTAHGKLDRGALPVPTAANALDAAAHADAASPAEARLLAILGEVMGDRDIGVDDNFFLLGGHSLLGTQVVLRASDAFGVELTLRDLFHAPTVRKLAAVIERKVEELVAALSDDDLLRAHG